MGARFSDAQCGFNAARTEVVQALLPAVQDEAWFFDTELLLPAFALTYLYAAPGTFVRRIGRLLAAGAVLVVASGWWMVVVDRWPASSRPYVGGSTDDTVWDLVIGYNGLGRIFGGAGDGGGPAAGGGRTAARITAVALAAAVAAGQAGPAAYAVTPLGAAVNGTNPTAGPSQGMGGPFGGRGPGGPGSPCGPVGPAGVNAGTRPPGGATAPEGAAPGGKAQDGNGQGARGMRGPGGQVDAATAAYLKQNKGSATWLWRWTACRARRRSSCPPASRSSRWAGSPAPARR